MKEKIILVALIATVITAMFCALNIDSQSETILALESEETSTDLDEQYYLDEIHYREATEKCNSYDNDEIVVAIIDTGCDLTHDDLVDNLWVNVAEQNGEPGVDDDGNGYIDDIHGVDFINDDSDPIDDSDNSHGTHVSGIVGMNSSNAIGYKGINLNTKIMIIKAGTANDKFYFDKCTKAVNYAKDNGADVINMSFGSTKTSDDFKAALQEASKSCILVAAAGNSAYPASENPFYPAAYPFVIGVMSSDCSGNLWEKSNYDDTSDSLYNIICPGESIQSTLLDQAYGNKNGTSMSTPMVSGSCAILMGLLSGNKTYQDRETLLSDTKKCLLQTNELFSYPEDSTEPYYVTKLNLLSSINLAISLFKSSDVETPTVETSTPDQTTVPRPVRTTLPTPTCSIIPSPTSTTTPTPICTTFPTPISTTVPSPISTTLPTPVLTATPTPVYSTTPSPTYTTVLSPTSTTIPTPDAALSPTSVPTNTPLATPSQQPSFAPIFTQEKPTLSASSIKNKYIKLTWKPTLLPTKWMIYRSTKKGSLGSCIGSTYIAGTFIDHSNKIGKKYYYTVTNGSVSSNRTEVYVPKKITVIKIIKDKKNNAVIRWKRIHSSDRYRILIHYRSNQITRWQTTKKTKIKINTKKINYIKVTTYIKKTNVSISGPAKKIKLKK